jgi:hypothetical protein
MGGTKMPTKGDQFYGYIAQWEGYPFYTDKEIPMQYGSVTVDGNHPSGSTKIAIKQTVGEVATGDNIIINNVGYLILEYTPIQIIIEPGLHAAVSNNTICSVIHSVTPPTTFNTVNDADPKVKLIAASVGIFETGALAIIVSVAAGEPEPGQYILVGGDSSDIRYLIDSVNPGSGPGLYVIGLVAPGLEFQLRNGIYISQTRNQWLEITDLIGEIYMVDMVRLLDFYYQIIEYQEETEVVPEAVLLVNPGLLQSVPSGTMGRIYH